MALGPQWRKTRPVSIAPFCTARGSIGKAVSFRTVLIKRGQAWPLLVEEHELPTPEDRKSSIHLDAEVYHCCTEALEVGRV